MLHELSILVNLGIGIFRQTEENLQTSFQSVERRILELRDLGEKEKTEVLFQVEELLKKSIRDSRKIEMEIQKILTPFFLKVDTKLNSSEPSAKVPNLEPLKIKKSKKVKAA